MTDYLRTNYRLTGGYPNDSEVASYWYHGNVTDSFTGGSYATKVDTIIGYSTSLYMINARYYFGADSLGAGGNLGQPTASYMFQAYATTSTAASYVVFKARWVWGYTSAGAAETTVLVKCTTSVTACCVLWDALVVSH